MRMRMRDLLLLAMALLVVATVLPAGAEQADDEADETSLFGWVGNMRTRMIAKQYELDDTTAAQLLEIVRAESMEKKALNGEIADLVGRLDEAVRGGASTEEITGLIGQIKEKKTLLPGIENRTIDRVVQLLGPEKAAKWLLSRRGVFQRVGGAVRRAGDRMRTGAEGDTSPPRPASRPVSTGYGR